MNPDILRFCQCSVVRVIGVADDPKRAHLEGKYGEVVDFTDYEGVRQPLSVGIWGQHGVVYAFSPDQLEIVDDDEADKLLDEAIAEMRAADLA
jgi:hypothetical protein